MRSSAIFKAAALAATTALPGTPALAAGDPIDVRAVAASSVAQWSDAVSQDLERNVAAIVNPPMQHRRVPNGVVSVRFRWNEQGRPEAIEIAERSGTAELDGIGRQAVSRLRNRHPLPAGIGRDQVYEANILLASDAREHGRQLAALRQRQETLRAAGQQTRVLALSAVYAGSAEAE